jgi:predicted enzyme related to lactoylglutathione lyase
MSEENGLTFRSSRESLRLRVITASLTVSDLDASLYFYRDVMGFTVHELWEHEGTPVGADLVAGTAHLLIGQDDFAKGRDREKGIGFRLYFTTTQSVDDVAQAVKERGGDLASEPEDMPWGGRAFSMVDPDGFNVTIASDG